MSKLAHVQAVADQYVPAFLRGERAPAGLYADSVTVWHNIGEREETLSEPPSFARMKELIPDLRREDVSVHVHEDGFLIRATTCGSGQGGSQIRIPAAVAVTVRDGRITSFHEYADSAAAAPMLALMRRAEGGEDFDSTVPGIIDNLIARFDLQQVLAEPIKTIGTFRVFKGAAVRRVAHVNIALEDGSVAAHMMVANTPLDSPLPHFSADITRMSQGFFGFTDLLPKVDLAAYRAYTAEVYEPLDEAFTGFVASPRVSLNPLPPRLQAMYSPWVVHHGTTRGTDLTAVVGAYAARFADLVERGIQTTDLPDAARIADRDHRHRATLFAPDFDPVWNMIRRIIGEDALTLILGTLSSPPN